MHLEQVTITATNKTSIINKQYDLSFALTKLLIASLGLLYFCKAPVPLTNFKMTMCYIFWKVLLNEDY